MISPQTRPLARISTFWAVMFPLTAPATMTLAAGADAVAAAGAPPAPVPKDVAEYLETVARFAPDRLDALEAGEPIVKSGMHHQVCVAMMGLPFEDPTVHSAEFYVDVVRRLIARGHGSIGQNQGAS